MMFIQVPRSRARGIRRWDVAYQASRGRSGAGGLLVGDDGLHKEGGAEMERRGGFKGHLERGWWVLAADELK